MKVTNEFLIPFIGLKLGKHTFDFQINKKFFADFDYHEFEDCDIKISIVLEKKSTLLELDFKQKGTVHVPCDLTSEMFDLPVKAKLHLVVQFGDHFNNDNEELLILPHGEHQLLQLLQLAQLQVKHICTTELTGMKVKCTTEVK